MLEGESSLATKYKRRRGMGAERDGEADRFGGCPGKNMSLSNTEVLPARTMCSDMKKIA